MRIRSMMEKEAQRGTKLQPFDLSEHSGNVAEALEMFLRLYKCKYAAWTELLQQMLLMQHNGRVAIC